MAADVECLVARAPDAAVTQGEDIGSMDKTHELWVWQGEGLGEGEGVVGAVEYWASLGQSGWRFVGPRARLGGHLGAPGDGLGPRLPPQACC